MHKTNKKRKLQMHIMHLMQTVGMHKTNKMKIANANYALNANCWNAL